jgi:protein O-GlcNAc transferase
MTGGATATDALWAGLPIVTCVGNSFPGRIATSQLHAVGLPELITTSLQEYESLALQLARNPAQLASIRDKLARNRLTCDLFDTDRFTKHIEAAYRAMWERMQAGQPPAHFSVCPVDR